MSSLKKYEMVETSILHLRDANDDLMYADGENGEPDQSKPQRVELYGPGTKQYARAQAALSTKNLARMQRKGSNFKISAEDSLKDSAEFCAAVTKRFENIDSEKNATGEDLFMEVYGNIKLKHIVEQCEAHARNTANFSPPSTKN